MTKTLFGIKLGSESYGEVLRKLNTVPSISEIQYHLSGRAFSACAVTEDMIQIREKISNLGLQLYGEQEIEG